MTYDPRTDDEIYDSLKSSLQGRIAKLRNFTKNSFNNLWGNAFADELRRLEVLALTAQLNGWIDYVGGNVSNDDLEDLGVADSVDASEIDNFMDSSYLDEYVKIVGVERFKGAKATGNVTFDTVSAQTDIPKGTIVTTAPDSDGNVLEFETTKAAETANGVTQVTDVPIRATEVGPAYNVPAGKIIRLNDPPVGVTGVTNPNSTTGGEDRESDAELRARAKTAVESSSQGGTVDGIKGYLRQEIDAVGQGDVIIEEFTDSQPPFVDVIVDGGLDSNVTDAIEFSRPAGIEHNLVRPQIVQLGINANLLGTDIDTASVESDISDFLLAKGIGDNFYEDELIRKLMNSDEDIINIDRLDPVIERVTNETFTYDSNQSDYRLDFTFENTNGSITVSDVDGNTFTQGTDYEVQDQTGDGFKETLVWLSGDTPADGKKFFVDYDVTVIGSTAESSEYKSHLVRDETFVWNAGDSETFTYDSTKTDYTLAAVPFDASVSITDASGNTYTNGTDFNMVDASGNGFAQTVRWDTNNSTPDDNEDFTVTYDQKLYQTEYEITDIIDDTILDQNSDSYSRGTDFQIVDYSDDFEDDAIEWLTNPSTIADSDEFYYTYENEGDIFIANREKIDPGTITATTE